MEQKSSFVYLLLSSDNMSSYVGATIDVDHRLRQHNKEIKGGAYATAIKVNQGLSWRRVCYIKNFPDWKSALQFEWRFKQISRKLKPDKPLIRRLKALKQLLSLQQPTTKAVPYSEWTTSPEIIWTFPEDESFYAGL
jgi:structure-specific endonuclease subunit SLX1